MNSTAFALAALSAFCTLSSFDFMNVLMNDRGDNQHYFNITYEQLWNPPMAHAQPFALPELDEMYDANYVSEIFGSQIATPSPVTVSPHSTSSDETQLMVVDEEHEQFIAVYVPERTPSPVMAMIVEELSPVDRSALAPTPVPSDAAVDRHEQAASAPITTLELLHRRSSRMIAKLMQARRDDAGFEDRDLNIPCPTPDCSIYIKAESKALAHCCRHIAGRDGELERLLTDAAVTTAIAHDELDSGLVVYACHQCDRYFSRLDEFNEHVRSIHADGVACMVSGCPYNADASMQMTTKFFCSALSQHILGEHKSNRKAYAMYSVLSGGGYMTSGHMVRHHRSILERFQQR